jgi:predicted nucleic acid-binding protein
LTQLALIDTNVFLTFILEDPGWEYCGRLLDEAYAGKIRCLISTIQLSELYTPFKRTGDLEGLEKVRKELEKLRVKIRPVDRRIAEFSSDYRSQVRTPEGRWISLADSILLATAEVEGAEVFYTLDPDFLSVERIKVSAPYMSLEEWVRKFQTK